MSNQLPPVASTAPDDQPNPERIGFVRMEPGQPFVHYRAVCGAWGAFGYGVDVMDGRAGKWFCCAHRPER